MVSPPLSLEPKQERSVATRQRLLDAAVEELLAAGYAGLTTSAVAQRARVSRGAQQHHFPHKQVLVAEAVRHLAERQIAELRERIAAAPRGRARAQRALDVIYEQYGGPLFAATLELSLSSHHEPDLRPIVVEQERTISREISGSAAEIFGAVTVAGAGFGERWAMALGTARGIALLRLLGHPPAVVDRQWAFARRELLKLLLA